MDFYEAIFVMNDSYEDSFLRDKNIGIKPNKLHSYFLKFRRGVQRYFINKEFLVVLNQEII